MSFGAFGNRRVAEYGSTASAFTALTNLLAITDQGFTGHEMVDHSDIIHMNGRIYDSQLGHFLQADPFIQAPKNSQSYNRYSYVWNNPLRYTDPIGEWVIIAKWIADAVAIGLAAYNAWDAVDSTIEAGKVLADDNASTNEKAFAVASAAASIIDPTPGNAGKKLAGHTDDLVKHSHHLDDAASNVQKNQDALSGRVDGENVTKERVRHFTNSKGINGIKDSNTIKASDQNSVFTEKAKGKPGSPRDVEEKLGIGRGRGNNYVEFDAKSNEFQVIKNPTTGATERVFKGDVDLTNRNAKFKKNR